ncbi:hypothetical protein IPM09_01660 [Candidatus Saccharibacteria bacterium]|nr:MAG: hypothetical protein IPM09_01660 [Candidatus Saccharibacteria bacterium]
MAEFFQLVRTVPDFSTGSAKVVSSGPVVLAVGTREYCERERRIYEAADRATAETFSGTITGISGTLAQYEICPIPVQTEPK